MIATNINFPIHCDIVSHHKISFPNSSYAIYLQPTKMEDPLLTEPSFILQGII